MRGTRRASGIWRAAGSLVMPGPLRACWKPSIGVVGPPGLPPALAQQRLPQRLHRDAESEPLRCAADSAETSSHHMPHTFSVEVLKKIENSFRRTGDATILGILRVLDRLTLALSEGKHAGCAVEKPRLGSRLQRARIRISPSW